MLQNMKAAYLVIAHGSREAESNESFLEFIKKFRAACPDRHVEYAFLELAKPLIPEAIERCIRQGAQEIFVIPMMLFPGRHVKEHIPQFIQDAKMKHPGVDFHYSSPLADHPMLVSILKEKTTAHDKRR